MPKTKKKRMGRPKVHTQTRERLQVRLGAILIRLLQKQADRNEIDRNTLCVEMLNSALAAQDKCVRDAHFSGSQIACVLVEKEKFVLQAPARSLARLENAARRMGVSRAMWFSLACMSQLNDPR